MRYLIFCFVILSHIPVLASERIVGGTPANEGEQPWQAFISVDTPEASFICGGSLIDKDWILTAAHCVFNPVNGNQVLASEINILLNQKNIKGSGGTNHKVSSIVVHGNYNDQTLDSDIALLKLSSSSALTPLILDQAGSSVASVGAMARVRGWGLTSDGGTVSDILLQTDVPIISNSSCEQKYDSIGFGPITANMLCAGFDEGGKDACQGDSGGPLTVFSNSAWIQVGIVSNGVGCAVANQPGVYTRVSRFNDFINDNIPPDVTPPVPPPTGTSSNIVNISTRALVQTGDKVMIAGFIITDTSKNVLIKVEGPGLESQGVPNVLSDPTLSLFSGQTELENNDDWTDSPNQAAIEATGRAPSSGLESAILRELAPGAYTAIVRGFENATGVALVAADEISGSGNIINISTRSFVNTGDEVMIAGFILKNSEKVLIKAEGPLLTGANVEGAMSNPSLELFGSSGPIASNDDWMTNSNQAEIAASGLAPSDSRESALLVTLGAGAYTAIVRGVGGETGVALVSVTKQ